MIWLHESEKLQFNDLPERTKFFVDVLFENYHPENLNRRIRDMSLQELLHPEDLFFDDPQSG